MEKQPLLQFYVDETWGYDSWDEGRKRKEGIRVKYQQEKGETREAFFKRVSIEPKPKMYGSDLKKDKKVRSKDSADREDVARREGYGLDVLVYDKYWLVRCRVAKHGYGLDILVNDKDWHVRADVASQGYGLDTLVHDAFWGVRQAVAEQGFGLDILVQDEESLVRSAVARQGFGLDILVHDEHWLVREEVARQGYGLDVLVHDEDKFIQKAVEGYLRKEGYPSIEAWIEENPGKCADRKNR